MAALRIGFVGLGMMGLPLARRLAEHGHVITAIDPAPGRVEMLSAGMPNVAAAISLEQLALGAEVIITCLPDESVVEATYLTGAPSLAASAPPGTITIDHSTISPPLARAVHKACAERHLLHVEAPLLGGPAQAAARQLFAVVSGGEAAHAQWQLVAPVREILATVARGWRWLGGPGAATTFKVLQNGLGLVQLAAMGEVAEACRILDLDPRLFYKLVCEAGGMAATPLFRERFPRMTPSAPVEARLAVAAKDARLYRDLVQGTAESSPAAASAAAFEAAIAAGWADEDVTAVWRAFGRDVA